MSFSSRKYWEDRYLRGATSGWGSYGTASRYKTAVINDFLERFKPSSAIEFGCGDGNQIKSINYKNYLGLDFQPAVKICKELYKNNKNLNFDSVDNYTGQKADLTLSLDVIYHLVEDEVFRDYMNNLFNSSKKYVVVFTTDRNDIIGTTVEHCFSRAVSPYIKQNFKNFVPLEFESANRPKNFYKKNPFSDANFLFFERVKND
jgi:hypothetical protein